MLDIFTDGSIYTDRVDIINTQVDQTVHYIGADGAFLGVARVPLNEFRYTPKRSIAINTKGEVFVLLPRSESIDVIRLNFFKKLEPLIPEAAVPSITIGGNNP